MLKPNKIEPGERLFLCDFLPEMKDIPKPFIREVSSKWMEIIEEWYYEGLPGNTRLKMKEGISKEDAVAHIRFILHSEGATENHKLVGGAYLLSLWFEDIIVPNLHGAVHG